MKKSNAQASVIVVTLTILLVFAAFIIIANVYKNLLKKNTDEISIDPFTNQFEFKTGPTIEDDCIKVSVQRIKGSKYVKKLRFFINYNDGTQETKDINDPVQIQEIYQNQEELLCGLFNLNNLKSLRFIPIFSGNNIGLESEEIPLPNCFDITADPILICNEDQFLLITNNLNGHYQLTKDLDFTPSPTTPIFKPIGQLPIHFDGIGTETFPTPFEGIFDGDGHTINGVTYSHPGPDIGIFARIGSSGIVKNVGIINLQLIGSNRVGGITGNNYGLIQNVFTTGTITTINDLQGPYGEKNNAGGLVGNNEGPNGIIENSYSTVTITGDKEIGGIVGDNDGIIRNVYFNGQVGSLDRIGGITGESGTDTATEHGIIENSYSIGEVTGTSLVSGLLGNINPINLNDIKNSYYFYSPPLYTPFFTTNNYGLTTEANLKSQTWLTQNTAPEFNNWDFVNIWKNDNPGTDYPTLRWQS